MNRIGISRLSLQHFFNARSRAENIIDTESQCQLVDLQILRRD